VLCNPIMGAIFRGRWGRVLAITSVAPSGNVRYTSSGAQRQAKQDEKYVPQYFSLLLFFSYRSPEYLSVMPAKMDLKG